MKVRLRPHAKTHKCIEIARIQIDVADPCLTVSTLAEAQYFMDAGFKDICWALPLAPCHIDSALDLSRQCPNFSVLLDHMDTFRALSQRAAARSIAIGVWLKVDCGYHRAGLQPADPHAIRLAAALQNSPWTRFEGLLAHGGHSYGARTLEERRQVAHEERDQTLAMAQILRQNDIVVPRVSIGSTPTLHSAEHLDGIDEIRPGNYIFYDRSQVSIGACSPDEIAVDVLSTVIGVYPERHTAIIDAGALAMSKDIGEGSADYGEVLDIHGQAIPGIRLMSLSQEHGKIIAESGVSLPPIHSKLRIRPNHSCLTAALFGEYHIHRQGEVIDIWRPVRGWTLEHGRQQSQ